MALEHKAIFFFLVYRSSDPNFCILKKINKIFLNFFYFLRCKKLPDLKYAFHFAVRNVERQIVSHFVTEVLMFQPINMYNQSCLELLSFVILDFALLSHSNFPR